MREERTSSQYNLEELRKLRTPVRNANVAYKENLTRLERFALWTADHIGGNKATGN